MWQTASPWHAMCSYILVLHVHLIFLPIGCSNASFSTGAHPALPGYFLRNHLTKQELRLAWLISNIFPPKPLFSRYGSVKCLSIKLRQTSCWFNSNQDSESLRDSGVGLTDRRGMAAAAWRWLALVRGFLRWAWCLPTCPQAPCPSPSAGHSFWTTAALHPPRPARSLWTVPWQRRNLKRRAGTMSRVSISALVKHTALRRRPCSMLASAPLFSH